MRGAGTRMEAEDWLELAEAAEILGVHQSTLRRWADAGKVPHMRTLSGRRRFLRAALEQSRLDMQRSAAAEASEQLEAKILGLARQRTSALSGQQTGWYDQLNEEHRLLFRYSGQRMLGLVMQVISHGSVSEKLLEEGRRVSTDYGRICCRAGLAIEQTAEAFLYCRRSILESLQGTAGLGGPDALNSQRVFLCTVDFFDALLIATMNSYTKLKQQEGAVTFQGEQVGDDHEASTESAKG